MSCPFTTPGSLEPRHEPQQARNEGAQRTVAPEDGVQPIEVAVEFEVACAELRDQDDFHERPDQPCDDEAGNGSDPEVRPCACLQEKVDRGAEEKGAQKANGAVAGRPKKKLGVGLAIMACTSLSGGMATGSDCKW